MDPVELHRSGIARCREVVAAVRDDQWTAPTPCEEWDVRDTVNHLTTENRWAPLLLEGATIEDVGDSLTGDLLGDDPKAAHDAAATAAQAKAEETELDRVVHLSYGDVEAAFFLQQRAVDLVVHAWDLAAATGQDTAIDEDVAETLLELTRPMVTPEVREAGVFGPPVEVPREAPASQQLLGLLGRDPGWTP